MKRRNLLLTILPVSISTVAAIYLLDKQSQPIVNAVTKFQIEKTEAQWRKILTPAQFNVLRKHGTERAGTSPLDKEYRHGTFTCAACNLALFAADTKFNSGTGWPSFYAPIPNAIATSIDTTFGKQRTEVHCRRCGGHLGHVFEDGPKPTGLRYCMNGVAMKFIPA